MVEDALRVWGHRMKERIGQDPRQFKGDPANAGNGILAMRSAPKGLAE